MAHARSAGPKLLHRIPAQPTPDRWNCATLVGKLHNTTLVRHSSMSRYGHMSHTDTADSAPDVRKQCSQCFICIVHGDPKWHFCVDAAGSGRQKLTSLACCVGAAFSRQHFFDIFLTFHRRNDLTFFGQFLSIRGGGSGLVDVLWISASRCYGRDVGATLIHGPEKNNQASLR